MRGSMPADVRRGDAAPFAGAGTAVPVESTSFDYVGVELDDGLRRRFEHQFCRDLERIRAWSSRIGWALDAVPRLDVRVSAEYRISKALVHVWSGGAGRMDFPARRVAVGNAAIAHELTHVFLPNGNRFLAEGLAIYLQSELGANPAFPNFGQPLHAVARERGRETVRGFPPDDPAGLEQVRLAELDRVATPSPLTLAIGQHFLGEEPRGQACLYAFTGSFVQFLIETRGLEKFRAVYAQTPLVARAQDAGTPDRWRSVYGVPFAELEREWKSLLAFDEAETALNGSCEATNAEGT